MCCTFPRTWDFNKYITSLFHRPQSLGAKGREVIRRLIWSVSAREVPSRHPGNPGPWSNKLRHKKRSAPRWLCDHGCIISRSAPLHAHFRAEHVWHRTPQLDPYEHTEYLGRLVFNPILQSWVKSLLCLSRGAALENRGRVDTAKDVPPGLTV